MPNWCENKLRVTGPKAEVARFMEEAKGNESGEWQDLDFSRLVPMPVEKKDDWYDWNIANWGCKWNATSVHLKYKRHIAVYEFSTPWGPPLQFLEKVTDLYRTLTFKLWYWEGGMGFKGHLELKDGEVVSENYNEHYRGNRGG